MPAPPPLTQMEAAGRRLRLKRLRRWVMGFVFGVPLLLLALALYALLGPKPPPPPVVISVTPMQAAQAEQNIDAVRQALTAPASVAPPPPAPAPAPATTARTGTPVAPAPTSSVPASAPPTAPPPASTGAVQRRRGPDGQDIYTLQVSQSDLNAYFAGNKKLKQKLETKGVHAVSIELHAPANIIVHANATLQGVTGNALVAATLTPDPKTGLRLDISDARFGLLPPPVVKAAANRVAGQVFGHAKTALPLAVQKAEVRGTDLILTGVARAPTPPKH